MEQASGDGDCHPVKIVVVGDCQCGKTALIKRYVTNTYSEVYLPTGFETFNKRYKVSEKYQLDLSIWDTTGNAGYDGVRSLSYDDTDLYMICFSIADPDSFENVSKKWLPEIRDISAESPIILVGCKSDLRTDESQPIKIKEEMMSSYEQGLNLAKEIGAMVYTETSAKTSAKSTQNLVEIAALSAAASSQPSKTKHKWPKSFLRSKTTDRASKSSRHSGCVMM